MGVMGVMYIDERNPFGYCYFPNREIGLLLCVITAIQMQIKKKLLRNTAILLALVASAGYFVVDHVLPYSGIKPMRRGPEQMQWLLPNGPNPAAYGLSATPLLIQSPDSLKLTSLLVASNTDTTKATVVLLHGISSCKETNFVRARLLADQGFASLLLDLRAHGSSEGLYCTFGYHEKNDLKAVADSLKRRFPDRKLGIWGASLGGAVALQAMGADKRYQFGIIESTFHEFDKVAMEYGADWFFGIRSWWLTNRVLKKSAVIAQFDPYSVRPVDAAARITDPVLFIHGDKDARIPMWFGEKNYEVCPAPGKRWFKVQGGGHNDLWRKAGPAMKDQISGFLSGI
jgi:pimeloyl-ACP methyl ester carboxylesterase